MTMIASLNGCNFFCGVDQRLLEGNALSLPPRCRGRASGNDGALPSTSKKYYSLKLPRRKKHTLVKYLKIIQLTQIILFDTARINPI